MKRGERNNSKGTARLLREGLTAIKVIEPGVMDELVSSKFKYRIKTFPVKLLNILIVSIVISVSFGAYKRKPAKAMTINSSSEQIVVYAAASLSDVLSEIIDSFEITYNIDVKVNTASSGTLARQIDQGGLPDVYISASTKWMDYIDSLGYILDGYKLEVAQNKLVLIAPNNSMLRTQVIDSLPDFLSLVRGGRLSIGDPAHVPAGRYAKQSLEYYGWYELLNKKLLPAKNVRSALMVVELEEVPVGIVYRTDAIKSGKVKILGVFPEKSHSPIKYAAGVCNDTKAAKEFFSFLNTDKTKAIWSRYGFNM